MEQSNSLLPKIKQALWQFRSPVVLPHDMPYGLSPVSVWESILDEEPRLQAYIKDIRMTAIPEGGYTYHVRYMNTQIPMAYVFLVESQEELCRLMKDMAGKFVSDFVALVGDEVDPHASEENFHHRDACRYPNLKATTLTTTKMQGSGQLVCTYAYTYRIPREILIERDKQVERRIGEMVDALTDKSASWRENAYRMYDYLINHVTYAHDTPEGDVITQSVVQSAYGALIEGRCVCQGMAEAYARLLTRAGIPCRVIWGYTQDGTRHAWNVVEDPHGNRGHHDLTWAVMRPFEKDTYFHANDQTMAESRTWDESLVERKNTDK